MTKRATASPGARKAIDEGLDGRTARRLFADDEGAQGVGAFDRAADGGGEKAVERECRGEWAPAEAGCGAGGKRGVDAGVGGGEEGDLGGRKGLGLMLRVDWLLAFDSHNLSRIVSYMLKQSRRPPRQICVNHVTSDKQKLKMGG